MISSVRWVGSRDRLPIRVSGGVKGLTRREDSQINKSTRESESQDLVRVLVVVVVVVVGSFARQSVII